MTADRRLYSMELGRRDHTRWLGSSRYAGGAPLTLPTTGLLAAYDARSFVSVDGGVTASTWTDISGNGLHATSAVAGQRAAISTADGYASLLFDGSTDWYTTPAITAATGVKTIYSVVKQTAVPTVYKTIFSPSTILFGIIPSTGRWGQYDSGNRDSGITSTTSRTRVEFEPLYTATSTRLWVNGSVGASTAWLGTGAIAAGSIGSYNGGASHFFAGHIMFLAFYNAARSPAVNDYITQEWGV